MPDPAPHSVPPLTAEEINALPLCRYEGPIRLVGPADLDAALDRLAAETLLGFDVETRPSFTRGEHHPPALLQLAGAAEVHLIPLGQLPQPGRLTRILSAPAIVKCGVAPRDDIRKLHELFPFTATGFVDLAAAAKARGYTRSGLRYLTAALMGRRISKGAQRTNWARPELTPAQIAYAATDAWASREICRLMRNQGWPLEEMPPIEPADPDPRR